MPNCQNCGGFVTRNYVQVFAPPETDGVRVCPQCEDVMREGADVREAHTSRR